MLPDIQALVTGRQQGKQDLAGMLPSSQNVGGGMDGELDPAAPLFQQAHSDCMALSAALHQLRDDRNANAVMKIATQIQSIALERRKKRAEEAADGGGGMDAVAGLNAMGVPE